MYSLPFSLSLLSTPPYPLNTHTCTCTCSHYTITDTNFIIYLAKRVINATLKVHGLKCPYIDEDLVLR